MEHSLALLEHTQYTLAYKLQLRETYVKHNITFFDSKTRFMALWLPQSSKLVDYGIIAMSRELAVVDKVRTFLSIEQKTF